ncbi:MAG TPA: DUF4381 family protein, partial [Planctomycetota bacterium]|nr:DUF4381 family protein [Planctomycetota bacterium]
AGLTVEGPQQPVLLGDRFELVVRGAPVEGALLELGELPDWLRADPPRLEAAMDGVRLVQPLRATRAGPLRFEQLALVSGDARQELPAVEVEVVLPLPDGAVPRVADPLPPVPAPPPPLAWWPLAAGLALLLAALAAWIAARRRRAVEPRPVAPPPDQVAISALARLRLALPEGVDAVPPFIDAVSAILRRYIEARFGLRAPESTTEEFLELVVARRDAIAGREAELRRFLHTCDLVKFARERPAPAAVTPLLDVAEAFVESTR